MKTMFVEKDEVVFGFRYDDIHETIEFEQQARENSFYVWFCDVNHMNAQIVNAPPNKHWLEVIESLKGYQPCLQKR